MCGADVPPRAKACPDCGADERTGWNEEATCYDGLDLPETAYHDEDPNDRATRRARINGIPVLWWVLAVLLLGLMLLGALRLG